MQQTDLKVTPADCKVSDKPDALLPCPFCGGTAKIAYWGTKPDAVVCEQCFTQHDDPASWNRRATDDRVRALVEAAVDVVAQLAATGTVELKIAETLCAALADIRIGVKGEK